MSTIKKLAIIDGKSVFYRGYYAMPNLSTKDGTPTGGVYGFAAMSLELIKKLKPDYVCVAWDKPKTNIRKRVALYPQYKAGRKPPPPDFYTQIPILHDLLNAFGWPLYELDDYEADDIMGALAQQASEKGIHTMLVTSDLDLLQCVGPKTSVYVLKKGLTNIELFAPEYFEQKYGISVSQFADLKALKGDSSDNIPGVPGVGEKTAINLLQQYHTLDGIYENVELISGSLYTKLIQGRESAYLSRQLAEIWCDAPVSLDLKAMDVHDYDGSDLQEVLRRLEFRSLLRILPEILGVKADPQPGVASTSTQISATKLTAIDSDEKMRQIDLGGTRELILHSRASGAHGRSPSYLAISHKIGAGFVIDLQKVHRKCVQDVLKDTLSDGSIKKIGYDLKNTIKVCIELGLPVVTVGHDVLIGAFILNPLRREQSLNDLAAVELGYEGASLDNIDNEEFATMSGDLLGVIRGLYQQQIGDLKNTPKLAKLVEEIEWPVIPVLASMEHEGIELDCDYLASFNEELTDQVSDLEQQIYGLADQEFNIASPGQLAKILFEKLQLPTDGVKRGKTGFSTAAAELEKLKHAHPIIEHISHYREATKLKSTYVDSLPKMVDKNSRLHSTFNLTIAQTGRLSSTDPNLQNIPVRTDLGRRIRTAFVASKGMTLVSADYNQFELRLAAVLANDQDLVDMFNREVDVHTITAAQLYGREPEEVTKQMRRDAKVINFGILYGMSPHGLARATGMTFSAAKTFIEKYFELRKPILDYMESLKELARTQGYVETLFGRRRPMPDIHSSNFVVRQAAERAATNMPIQGTEADLMKLAMVAVNEKLPKGAKQLLQIHDSILVECLEAQAEEVAVMMKEVMEDIYKLPVKLTVDTAAGDNWGEL